MADDYTDISAARTDADSDVDEDLMTDLADNDRHNFSHALRCGTFTTGVRRAFAGGTHDDTINTDGSGHGTSTGTITFASDAVDGPPNFSATPLLLTLTAQELSTGADLGTNDPSVSVWLDETNGITSTVINYVLTVRNATTLSAIDIRIHWAVAGLPTGTE